MSNKIWCMGPYSYWKVDANTVRFQLRGDHQCWEMGRADLQEKVDWMSRFALGDDARQELAMYRSALKLLGA